MGLSAHILSSSLNDLEVGTVAATLANIAREVENYRRPFCPPCVMIFGGEPTVSIGQATGKGGRNQEFALSAAPWIAGSGHIAVAAADTDGADGTTDVAGGIVDGYTVTRAQENGIDLFKESLNHNSHGVLAKLEDTIVTGTLGQNLRSLFVIYVASP
jgi:glycerate-2-kinase